MPRLVIPSPEAIERQQRRNQPPPDNRLYAPRPDYDPDADAQFYDPRRQDEKQESSYTFDIC